VLAFTIYEFQSSSRDDSSIQLFVFCSVGKLKFRLHSDSAFGYRSRENYSSLGLRCLQFRYQSTRP